MDKEFLFLAIVCTATLLVIVLGFWLPNMPIQSDEDAVEAFWEDCEKIEYAEENNLSIFATREQAALCQVRQKLIDANLWEASNG